MSDIGWDGAPSKPSGEIDWDRWDRNDFAFELANERASHDATCARLVQVEEFVAFLIKDGALNTKEIRAWENLCRKRPRG